MPSLHPAGKKHLPPGYLSIAQVMEPPRDSYYLYSEYTKDLAQIFIQRNLPREMIDHLTYVLTLEMHQMIAQLAIKHHTIGWAFDPTQYRTKRLTIDDCKNDLKKMYIMYYNVYRNKLLPKGQIRDALDPMKNFKNRSKVIQANMFQHTFLDGNTLDAKLHDSVIIP